VLNPSVEGLIADYRKRLQDAPEDPDLHYNLALAYRVEGSFELAIQELLIVTHLIPDFAEAFYQLGLLYRQIGDIEKAREAFQEAAMLDPDRRYSTALHRLGNGEESAT